MKLQYLGDSKDSFKWDYHDYLINELGYPLLNIALMLTPDDNGNDGKSHPSLFPARNEIIEFCHNIQQNRSIESIRNLPKSTGAQYRVSLHKDKLFFNNENREKYFLAFDNLNNQVVFLDPDNGFEPEKSFNEKHVRYCDIENILDQVPKESVISVFQHHRRKSFTDDFSRIRERIKSGYSTAIYWHSLMFVALSKSENAIQKVLSANKKYAESNPVKVIT